MGTVTCSKCKGRMERIYDGLGYTWVCLACDYELDDEKEEIDW